MTARRAVAVPGATASEANSYTYDAVNRKLATTFADGSMESDSYSATTADLIGVSHETNASAVTASNA